MDLAHKEARIKRSIDHIDKVIREIEQEARRKLLEPGVTSQTRRAVDVAHKRYVLRQGLRVRDRFGPEQQRWMWLLIADRLIENPGLYRDLRGVVDQLRRNYGFEWVTCPFTLAAQREARNIILTAAESEFGDTPAAGPLAYVRSHHRKYKIRDITNYDEVYLRAVRLEYDRLFVDRGREAREKLRIRAPVAESVAPASSLPVPEPGSGRS